MKTGRVVISGTVVGVLLVAFFTVPLPVSRVRQTGLVLMQDSAETPVLLREDGRLDELKVVNGEYVHKGQELARFTNRELERKALEAESRGRSLREQREVVLQELAERSQDADTTQRLKRKKNDMDTEIQKLDKDLEILKPHIDTLTLRAPCDGWVINPPQPEEQGKFFDHTQPAPFCVIGDPQRLRMLVPVKPADYRLLKQDREALAGTDKDLPISIRIQGRDSCTWVGEWQVLPESEAKQIPLPLSNKGGGPISVKPPSGNDPNKLEPVDQQYMLSLTIKDPDKAVVPGSRGTVKIECRWRSAAWWVWRTVNDTFDLGLM